MEYQLTDNFWALKSLESAAWLAHHFGEHTDAEMFKRDAARYTSHINAAIHRELEYGLSQQVPGRLHRAFDPATAAELLDIALMPEAHRMLRANIWLERLLDKLIEPADQSAGEHDHKNFSLRNIDQQGVCPARRMLLALAMLKAKHPSALKLLTEVECLTTPFNVWPQYINIHSGHGNGRALIDPEAASLFIVLVRSMLLDEDDHRISIAPALATPPFNGNETITLHQSATLHGRISATLQYTANGYTLDLHTNISDPTVEIQWCTPESDNFSTYACHSPINLGIGKAANGRHTQKFPQPSNNPAS